MEQRISDLIILLAGGINQRRMYFDAHPKVRAFSEDFTIQLRKLLADDPDGAFSFGVFKGKFVRKGSFLVGPSIAGRSLIAFAEALGCGGFSFRLPVEPEDIITFFRLAASTKEPVANLKAARDLFAHEGIGHIQLANPYEEGDDGTYREGAADDSGTGTIDNDFTPLMAVYQALYEIVARNNAMALHSGGLDITDALTCGEDLVRTSSTGVLDVMQFIRYPDYDSYTIGHSVRVGALAVVIGRKLGLEEHLLTELATAGLLHDLGKGRIPEEILFKPGSLDADERRIMESHPALGAQLLLASGEATEIMVSAAWGHHIRMDGGGYPRMPEWHSPGFAAAIIHVCDVFEALTAARPYKDPIAPLQAYAIMLKDEGSYDPRILAALVEGLGLYPPGSAVLLTDGRRAVVTAVGDGLDRPRVRISHDSLGLPVEGDHGERLDLGVNDGLGVAEILVVGTG